MRRGICVKCGAATVRAGFRGMGRVDMMPHMEPGSRGIAVGKEVEPWVFVCTTCGYLETYLLDPGALGFAAEKWLAVPPQAVPPPAP